MAEILSGAQNPHNKSAKRHRLNIDMTPMVDLGFLLITFFIFSAMLVKPTAMKLIMPAGESSTPSPAGRTMTLLLGSGDKLLCYEGFARNNSDYELIDLKTSPAQLRQRINTKIEKLKHNKGAGAALNVIIKPSAEASYGALVAALDEMTINGVGKYAVAGMDNDDLDLMAAAHVR